MSLSKNLVTPVDLGDVITLAASRMEVACVFNTTSGQFEIVSMNIVIREGELTGAGPYTWTDKRSGSVSVAKGDMEASLLAALQQALDDAIDAYATEKGYQTVEEVNVSDTLVVSITGEDGTVVVVLEAKEGGDTLTLSVGESAVIDYKEINVSDTLTISVSEASTMLKEIASSDTLAVSITGEDGTVVVP